jgi:hypothetical protein
VKRRAWGEKLSGLGGRSGLAQVWRAASMHLVLDSGMLLSQHYGSAQERREAGVAVMTAKLMAHTKRLRAASAEPRRVCRSAGGGVGLSCCAAWEGALPGL